MIQCGGPIRRAALQGSRVSIESLEQRLLYYYYAIDTSFGDQGYLPDTYNASARADGSVIIGDNKLLHPDGTPGPIIGTPAPVAVPQPSLVNQNVQADGRYYQADPKTGVTRYNKNGTIDKTFGVNGTVNSFIKNTPATSFTPRDVLVYKMQILVVGDGMLPYTDNDTPTPVYKSQAAVVRLKQDGSIDASYGTKGITWDDDATSESFGLFDESFLGPDGSLYLPGIAGPPQIDGQSLLAFDVSGHRIIFTWSTDDNAGAVGVGPFEFTHDGKLIYAEAGTVYLPGGGLFLGDPFYGTPDDISLGVDGKIYVATEGWLICVSPSDSPSVTGRFFTDNNGNHKQDAGEPGLPYWQAYADLNNNGVFDLGEPTAFADVRGIYSIDGLKPGTYHIREVRQSGWTRTTPSGDWPTGGVYTVTVTSSKVVTGVNFGNSNPIRTPGSISGTIFDDIDGSQQRDAGEGPLAGWQVYADTNDNGVYDTGEAIATADKSGHYTLSKLLPGGYRIREIRRDGWARTTPPGNWPLGYFNVPLGPGQAVTGMDFGNARFATITGFVYRDQNGNGKLDAGETGAAGAILRLDPQQPAQFSEQVTVGADGRYTFANLPPNTYTITVVRSGFAGDRYNITSPGFEGYGLIALTQSQTFRANLFLKPTMALISGAVFVDANNNAKIDPTDPHATGFAVYVDANNDGVWDNNERYEVSGIDFLGWNYAFGFDTPGTYYIRLMPSAGYHQTVPAGALKITVALGDTVTGVNFAEFKPG